jgi:hypothetical protein
VLVPFQNIVFEIENQREYVRIVVDAIFLFSIVNFYRSLSNDQLVA